MVDRIVYEIHYMTHYPPMVLSILERHFLNKVIVEYLIFLCYNFTERLKLGGKLYG